MQIYDKAIWHIDAGENSDEVLEKYRLIFFYLRNHDMLTPDGMELFDGGVDSSMSLNESLLTKEGNDYIKNQFDFLFSCDAARLKDLLSESSGNGESYC